MGTVFAALDDKQFQQCFITWAGALKKAHYLFGLTSNQGCLREVVELFFAGQKARGFAETTAGGRCDRPQAGRSVDSTRGRTAPLAGPSPSEPR